MRSIFIGTSILLWSALAASPAGASYCDALYSKLASIQADESALDRAFPLTRDAFVSSHVDIDSLTNVEQLTQVILNKPEVAAKCLILGKNGNDRNWCDVYDEQKFDLNGQRLGVEDLIRQNGCQ